MTQTLTPVAAPARITIHVTAEDIAAGVPGDSHECMVAQALMRTFELPRQEIQIQRPLFTAFLPWPAVCSGRVLLPSGHFAALPTAVVARIQEFDRMDEGAAPLAPFSFEIEVPA